MAAFSINRHIRWMPGGILGVMLVVVVCLFTYAWFSLSKFGACRNIVLTTVPSPDAKKSVVTFRKECGATVRDSYHASIVPAGKPFSEDRDIPFLSLGGTAEILASWRGNDVVEIALIPGGIRELKHEVRVGDIQVDYR